jgi:hypothetical protein
MGLNWGFNVYSPTVPAAIVVVVAAVLLFLLLRLFALQQPRCSGTSCM